MTLVPIDALECNSCHNNIAINIIHNIINNQKQCSMININAKAKITANADKIDKAIIINNTFLINCHIISNSF